MQCDESDNPRINNQIQRRVETFGETELHICPEDSPF